MSRPIEPYSHDAEPERWAEIAEWECERADELQKKLDDLNDNYDTLVNQMEEVASDANHAWHTAKQVQR